MRQDFRLRMSPGWELCPTVRFLERSDVCMGKATFQGYP